MRRSRACLLVRRSDLAGRQRFRMQDNLLAGVTELVEVLVLHVPVLSPDGPAFQPVPVRPELYRTDDGVDGVVVQPLRELRLVQRADRLDGRLDELTARVEEGRQEMSQTVDAPAFRERPITLQELVDAGEIHG